LVSKSIPEGVHAHYLKWLRYYLDFCHKYGFNESIPQSLPDFIGKLKKKKQADAQQKQADSSIRIYYELIRAERDDFLKGSTPKKRAPIIVKEHQKKFRAPSSKGNYTQIPASLAQHRKRKAAKYLMKNGRQHSPNSPMK